MLKQNPMKMLQNINLVKQAVKEGGEYFDKKEGSYEIQNNLIQFKTRGDHIIGIKLSEDMKSMLNDDPDMFEDLLATSFNSLKAALVEARTKSIMERGKQLKIPQDLMNSINSDEIMGILG